MSDGDTPYWPSGFFSELVELVESATAGDELSGPLDAMYERAATEIVASAIEHPRRALTEELGQRAAFEARLDARWGQGLDLFELTVQQALDAGRRINAQHRPAAAARQDQKFEALIRLHSRSVMTAIEVLVLLRAGFSTGALARWRTIHEIWVVFSLLVDGDEELSRRYLVHEVVESMKAEKEYEETWQALGHEPPDWAPAERNERRDSLRRDFGEAFLHDYGWAAPLFEGRAPRFRALQQRARLDHWRGYYRMASHGTHANPKGVRWTIQAGAPVSVIWAGPSNAGLLDPAQCTLIALANVTVGLLLYAIHELIGDDDTLVQKSEALVEQRVVLTMMDRTIDVLAGIHDRQKGEEQALGDLIDRAIAVLRVQPLLTSEELADMLDVHPSELAEALVAAQERGRLDSQQRYRVPPDRDGEPHIAN